MACDVLPVEMFGLDSYKRNTVQIVLVVNRIVTSPLVWGHQGQGVCVDGAQIGEVTDSGITLLLVLGTNAKLFHRLSPSWHWC